MAATAPYLLRLYEGQAGLCNQILALINGIIMARRQGKTEIKLSPFLTCIHLRYITNAAKIFDLPNMAAALGVKFVSAPVFQINYGIDGNYRDITSTALSQCKSAIDIIDIPTDDVVRARLFGDHLPGVRKHIALVRDNSTVIFDDTKPIRMRARSVVCSDVNWSAQQFLMGWYNSFPEFDDIFPTIKFHPRLVDMVNTLTAQLDPTTPINVCHLRIEPDAVTHWSRMNKMTPETFQQHLFQLYRKYVATIPSGQPLIILTYDTEHKLVQEFKLTHQVYTFKHDVVGREVSAILDLLIGAKCTGTFIGCHNLELKRGSTFSYFLHKMIAPTATRHFIDLDGITSP